jgi:hypothetical protein
MKSFFFLLSLLCATMCVKAQNFPDVYSYFFNGNPVNGVKIKTNLPFTNSSQMPTIIIEGFNYDTNETINLTIVYYIFNSVFYRQKISSAGGYTPPVTLANENGKVVVFINDRPAFQRFHIRAYGGNYSVTESAAAYSNWSVVDSTLSSGATAMAPLTYRERLAGDVYLPGNSLFDTNGNLGIGTTPTGTYKLQVEGTIGARKIQVKSGTWADFVFQPDYQLAPLSEVATYIKTNQHLPGIPTAEDVKKDGVDVGEMNKLLLQKVEELTLYMIEMKKEIEQLKAARK